MLMSDEYDTNSGITTRPPTYWSMAMWLYSDSVMMRPAGQIPSLSHTPGAVCHWAR